MTTTRQEGENTGPDFSQKLKEIKGQFELVIQYFEQQDYPLSSETAIKIVGEMSLALEELAKDYPRSLYAYKFSQFNELEINLGKFHKEKNIDSNMALFTDTLVTLNTYINRLEKEIKKNYPQKSLWVTLVSKHKKIIALGVATILVLTVPFLFWRKHEKNKHGLRGEYFSKKNFAEIKQKRVDHTIDFQWGMSAPLPKFKKDGFSIRWTGYLRVPKEGSYEFYTHSDDGVALWIGEKNIISNWTSHGTTVDSFALPLKAGYHPIRLEYFDEKRRAVIRLLWKKEGDPRPTVISSKYLVPSKELLRPDIPLIQE